MIATDRRSLVGQGLFLLGGLLIWAVHFTIIYGFNALACARTFADSTLLGIGVVPLAIGLATVLALLATVLVVLAAAYRRGPAHPKRGDTDSADFTRYLAILVGLLAFVAILWDGLTVLFVPPCA